MEMQKQKPPRKKNKIITKRKVLSATMSGTLLMTSVVIPTAYSLLLIRSQHKQLPWILTYCKISLQVIIVVQVQLIDGPVIQGATM